MPNYTKYTLVLDKNDDEDVKIINYLKSKKGNKVKNSYSTIIKEALREAMEKASRQAKATAHK